MKIGSVSHFVHDFHQFFIAAGVLCTRFQGIPKGLTSGAFHNSEDLNQMLLFFPLQSVFEGRVHPDALPTGIIIYKNSTSDFYPLLFYFMSALILCLHCFDLLESMNYKHTE